MGIDELKVIATELVMKVRDSVTIDWTLRESARAKIRVMVRRILRKHGYPPDLQEEATKLVLEHAPLVANKFRPAPMQVSRRTTTVCRDTKTSIPK